MKAFVKLGLHSEYHGYDIFMGAYTTFDEALDSETFKFANYGNNLGCVRHTHCGDGRDENTEEHTHVVFYRKDCGIISEDDLKVALEYYDEDDFCESEYCVIESIVIKEIKL